MLMNIKQGEGRGCPAFSTATMKVKMAAGRQGVEQLDQGVQRRSIGCAMIIHGQTHIPHVVVLNETLLAADLLYLPRFATWCAELHLRLGCHRDFR